MPGTGIGVSAMVTANGQAPQAVSCEMQHTPMPVLDAEHEMVLNNMKTRLGINQPSWEDFISVRVWRISMRVCQIAYMVSTVKH